MKNYFLNGMTELIVLFFLNQKDCYVYEITKAVSQLSDELLVISQNTIYTAAYKLETEGLISEYSKLVGRKRTRVYYHIEPSGKEYLNELLSLYKVTYSGIEKMLKSNFPESDSSESSSLLEKEDFKD